MGIHADDIMQVIRDKGWWKGTGADGSPGACLAMALAEVALDGNVNREQLADHREWVRWDAALAEAAGTLFPDRAGRKPHAHINFNDHPDTTLADVELVVKEAERRL